jgi:hypothetical protein
MPENTCFVIMPFSKTSKRRSTEYWNGFFKNYLVQTLDELGYECVRSRAEPNDIVKSVVHSLFTTDIVLAILTDYNPNVWYELGVRQSIGHGTIMAIEEGQKIPFDIGNFGCITYDIGDRANFRNKLSTFLEKIKDRDLLDSPVAEYFAGSSTRLVRMASNVAETPLSTDRAIREARYDLFIVGQNLYSLAKDNSVRDSVIHALHSRPELRVRLMVVDPSQTTLVRALAQLINESMRKDLEESLRFFRSWRQHWLAAKPSNPGRLDIRLSGRVGHVSATFLDAETNAGLMLLRPILYHTKPKERPCFLIRRREAPEAFNVYFRGFDQEWTHAAALP